MPMTEEERYHFDIAGFLVRPAILAADEVATLVDHVDRLMHDRESLPPAHRHVIGGPASVLVDHPSVVDVLHDLLGPEVRMEGGFSVWRSKEERHKQGLHQGGWNQGDPVFGYRVAHGQIFSGLIRVIFELTDVAHDDGATVFLAGSHKANFRAPAGHLSLDEGARSPLLRSYECPAGSAIFFTENLLHAGPRWRRDTPRVAILNAYNHVSVNFHRQSIPDEVLLALPREKQAWFRHPWLADFRSMPPAMNTVEHFVEGTAQPMRVDF